SSEPCGPPSPVGSSSQVAPPLVDFQTRDGWSPLASLQSKPAYSVPSPPGDGWDREIENRVWLAAKSGDGRPKLLIGVHVPPPLVDLEMASLQNDAYMMFVFCGSSSKSVAPFDSDFASFSSVQLTPPSVDFQIPNFECTAGDVRRAPPRPRSTAANS